LAVERFDAVIAGEQQTMTASRLRRDAIGAREGTAAEAAGKRSRQGDARSGSDLIGGIGRLESEPFMESRRQSPPRGSASIDRGESRRKIMKREKTLRSKANRQKPTAPKRKLAHDEYDDFLYPTAIAGQKFDHLVAHLISPEADVSASGREQMGWRLICSIPIAQNLKKQECVRLYGWYGAGGILVALAMGIDGMRAQLIAHGRWGDAGE
jgi:hypothetical protein